jgi:maltose O-acetyltransferase
LGASIQKKKFASCGRDVFVGPKCTFNESHLFLGNHIFIGERASFMAAVANIYIDDYVVFGPNVTIRGGDHRTDVVGKHIIEVKEKLPENDKDVIIESGVWVGCNVVILKGVTVGRGAVIAAGSIVTKNVLPYSIVAGNPARILKMRFNEAEIHEHERQLRERLK